MKKGFLCIVLSLFLLPLFAEKVPAGVLAQLGTNAYQQRCPAGTEVALKNIDFITHEGDTLMALLHFNNGGFLLMSAEDAALPILGYSTTDDLPLDNIAPATQQWIADYQEQIIQIRKLGLSATEEVAAKWKSLSTAMKSTRSGGVSPLIAAKWDQARFYNDLCPADDAAPSGYGGHVPCGCAALAMAMVIHYYRYPETGQGSHGYNSNYGYFSVNFGQQNYNYNIMPYSLTKSCNEVAKLIYHCGIAIDMGYSADGSGAGPDAARYALKNYYKYSSDITSKVRNGGGGWGNHGYTDQQWIELLQENLDQHYPILYSGYTDEGGGHGFICDGYDAENQFHFNWGWGGSGNGFFNINNLNSNNGTFNSGHRIVCNIHPPTNNYPPYCQDVVINATAGSLEDGSGHLDYQNNMNCTYVIAPTNGKSVTIVMVELNTEPDADFLRIYNGDPDNGGTLVREFSGTAFNPTESFYISSGIAYITFQTDGSGTAPGWKLRFSAQRNLRCSTSRTLTDQEGTFTDGSGDEEYASDANCKWTINPNNASWVSLSFPEFDISGEDHINVYKGTSVDDLSLVGSYNNNTLPPAAITNYTGKVMQVEFLSDCYLQEDGFTARWTSDGHEDETSVEDHNSLDFETFPNPANTSVSIILPKNFENGKARITDMTGRTVLAHDLDDNDGIQTLPTTGLSSGIYIITLYNQKKIASKKLIIKH